jgi:predicted MFS family arabinose efflux permease
VNLLNLLHILNDGFLVSFSLLLPFLKADLNLNLVQIGFLGSVLQLLEIFLALSAGYVATKIGNIRSLTWAISLYGIGFLITAFSSNYWSIIIAFFIAGAGFGIFHPIAFATIAKLSPKEKLGKAMGNFTAIGDLGRIGVSAGITLLATYLGWRLTSGLYGAIAIGVFIYLAIFVRSNYQHLTVQDKKPISILYFLKHKLFLMTALTGFLDVFASNSLFVFIPFLLLSKGINPAYLGPFTGFFFVGNFLGKSVLGRFVDKIGSTKVFILSEFFMAINIVLFALAQNYLAIIVIAIVIGALTKGTAPVIKTMLTEATHKESSYENVFALDALFVGIANTIAPLFYGLIANSFGIVHVFTTSAIFALLAIISVVVTNLVFRQDKFFST